MLTPHHEELLITLLEDFDAAFEDDAAHCADDYLCVLNEFYSEAVGILMDRLPDDFDERECFDDEQGT